LEPDPLRNFLLKNRESDLVWNKITQGSYLILSYLQISSFLISKKFKTLKELMIFMKYMAKNWQF
jgi:hypothetical protein